MGGTYCQGDGEERKQETGDKERDQNEGGREEVEGDRTKCPPEIDGHFLASQDTLIPASVRPDGSVRRERRIRPGYRPEAEMPKYIPPPMRRTGEPARRTMASTMSALAKVIKNDSIAASGMGPGGKSATVAAGTGDKTETTTTFTATATATTTTILDALTKRLTSIRIADDHPDPGVPKNTVAAGGGNNAARYKLCNGHYELVTEEDCPYEGLWSP